MVCKLLEECIHNQVERVILHCATDLPSNEFWQAAGFQRTGLRAAASETRRPAHRYEWIFPAGRDVDDYLATIFQFEGRGNLANFLGMRDQLTRSLTNVYRRRKDRA